MTDGSASRKKVLLVGAGRRMQNNFLPAFACLRDHFEIAGIHARSATRMVPLAAQWGVEPVPDLSRFDLSGVDIVALSVPTSANAAVLRQLQASAAGLHVVIDTPIALNRVELRQCWSLLEAFAHATITEDYMNFPQFELARRAVKAGVIGKPVSATLDRIGYRYHGLALIRSLAGFPKVRSSRRFAGAGRETVRYILEGGFEASVLGPYERRGRLVLQGSEGVLVHDDGEPEAPAIPGAWKIVPDRGTGGTIGQFALTDPAGKPADPGVPTPEIAQMAAMAFPDKSEVNLSRGWGLVRVLRSVMQPDGLNDRYGARDALYDSTISRIASRGLLRFDPFRWIGSDFVDVLRRI